MPHPPVRPDGKLESTITHLEMLAPPEPNQFPRPRDDLFLFRALDPTVSFYRFLYNTVGEPWLWGDRRKMSDAELKAILRHPAVEVYVLYVAGVPAGYSELDRRVEGEVELSYFGIMPEFIGQKLGPYFLDWTIGMAWSYQPKRVWVHTCSLDHPSALAMYQRAGFQVFKTEVELGDDPRALGLIKG